MEGFLNKKRKELSRKAELSQRTLTYEQKMDLFREIVETSKINKY